MRVIDYNDADLGRDSLMQPGNELDSPEYYPPVILSEPFNSAVEPGTGQKHILVVDDEPTITGLLQDGLGQIANCEVMVAGNGEEALQLFKTTSFDLLITDYSMPRMDGLTLAREVQRLYPQVIVVLFTAFGSDWLVQQALEIDIACILNKPIKLPKIRRLVSELLEMY
jgi:CheY-like chemotaxis protein